MSTLRGLPDDLITVPHTRVEGVREDGTARGRGYFGPLAHTGEEACFATELPCVVGTKLIIPLLVPTLTREEISHLVCGGRATDAILEKALAHAEHRRTLGLSVFATDHDARTPLP